MSAFLALFFLLDVSAARGRMSRPDFLLNGLVRGGIRYERNNSAHLYRVGKELQITVYEFGDRAVAQERYRRNLAGERSLLESERRMGWLARGDLTELSPPSFLARRLGKNGRSTFVFEGFVENHLVRVVWVRDDVSVLDPAGSECRRLGRRIMGRLW
jgi:hypothetical protein